MKKALALVLALVLALSLGVSAFALDLVELDPAPEYPDYKLELDTLDKFVDVNGKEVAKTFRADAEGGTFYFKVDSNNKPLKNIEVESTGIVSAKVVKYNPDDMEDVASGWYLTKDGKEYDATKTDEWADAVEEYTYVDHHRFVIAQFDKKGAEVPDTRRGVDLTEKQEKQLQKQLDKDVELEDVDFDKITKPADMGKNEEIVRIKAVTACDVDSYEFLNTVATALNKADRSHVYGVETNDNIYLIELTVEPNYSAAYKTGSFKVSATRVDKQDTKTGKVLESTKVYYTGKVVSDVVIFEYDMVNYCGEHETPLYVNTDKGYSDYEINGVYGGTDYTVSQLRRWKNATVLSTTAFRALRENNWGIEVVANDDVTVVIPSVGNGQKGVNFANYKVTPVTKDANGKALAKEDRTLEFGFYGKQTIASDFTLEVDLGYTAYQLREFFGEKVEEEDIITYYVVKDGKVADSFTVDYMKDEINDYIELEIKGKAGDTLGEYAIAIKAPAEPEAPAEENPNTGAESVIGGVAALAVVSVAAAAAVSLKK